MLPMLAAHPWASTEVCGYQMDGFIARPNTERFVSQTFAKKKKASAMLFFSFLAYAMHHEFEPLAINILVSLGKILMQFCKLLC